MKKLSAFVLATFLFISTFLSASPYAFASTISTVRGNLEGSRILVFGTFSIPLPWLGRVQPKPTSQTTPPPANHPPVVANPISKQITTQGKNFQFTIPANTFSDPDGDNLTYSISTPPAGVTFDSNSRTISGTPFNSQDYTLTATVSDGRGGTASTPLTLTVTPGEYLSDNHASGEFTVPANLNAGVPLTNYTNKEVVVGLSAREGINYDPSSEVRNISPDGIPKEYLTGYIQYFEYPDYTPFSLVAVHQGNPPQVSQLGTVSTLTLPPNASVSLLVNGFKGGYNENSGSFIVQWSVNPS